MRAFDFRAGKNVKDVKALKILKEAVVLFCARQVIKRINIKKSKTVR